MKATPISACRYEIEDCHLDQYVLELRVRRRLGGRSIDAVGMRGSPSEGALRRYGIWYHQLVPGERSRRLGSLHNAEQR
ncbi:hypothetical protein GCM10009533_69400 [Saccharopolyspora spinosporotrichia]|uniref:Uncharacterized protein n=1 Tax=Saccharopolyspora erythraea TaxID=1836 RepID=A0ABP3PGN2_SACER